MQSETKNKVISSGNISSKKKEEEEEEEEEAVVKEFSESQENSEG